MTSNKSTHKVRTASRSRAKSTPKSKTVDYYAWQTDSPLLRGDKVLRCTKPGMAATEQIDPANLLLAENVQVAQGDSVLVLNCGAGLVGLVAAQDSQGGQIWLADANVVATEAARRTLEANRIKGVEVVTSSGTKHLPAEIVSEPCFDVVTVRLPKGKQLAIQLLLDGYNALRPGGRLYLAGANDEGIKSHLRNLDLLFGSSVLLGYKKGCRVAVATKAEGVEKSEGAEDTGVATSLPKPFNEPWLAHDYEEQFENEQVNKQGGRQVLISALPGIFASTKLDRGTATLLEHMEIGPMDRVLDLGCGSGILGAVAAIWAAEGHVVMVDTDINAVDAARQTLSANGLTNGEVLLSDGVTQLILAQEPLASEALISSEPDAGMSDMEPQDIHTTEGDMPASEGPETNNHKFDVVITNPPFHQGKGTQYDAGVQFIADAASVLKDGGRLYLVANQFLKYESEVDRHLGQCKTLFKDGRFKVLRGIKNPKPA